MLPVIRFQQTTLFQDRSPKNTAPMCAGRIDGSSRRKRCLCGEPPTAKKEAANRESYELLSSVVVCVRL